VRDENDPGGRPKRIICGYTDVWNFDVKEPTDSANSERHGFGHRKKREERVLQTRTKTYYMLVKKGGEEGK